ncbi:cyclase family protein [Pseudoclavibacter sp. RFBJ3]|uniref:cyclase family protein n=1 Tax=unclassified Pseudoclavibacter TaxID=2615177 RepID=UPI000CE7CB8E|nr:MULTISPECIES: cyclase family protein [unclassified Pseudoclavibacter]PPF83091.1 cyclase family protein [Pseudoclavibacter sp. RFBJ5]PPF91790.1 cyclase family protein [Pseudoclavibacter sp. RFBJ3]PPF96727.1 cyclase family protein [Pseudoclavibacter sp. RFBH5]PPG19650.1 cyclase family protein [Pseudoclavibacter sp. RFBI4]
MAHTHPKIVDLTHPLSSGMQIYPGDPEVRVEPATSLADDGVVVHALQLGTHTGTHLDAPSHSIADGATVDRLDLGRLAGPLHLVDVTELAQPGDRIELAQVAAQLEQLAAGTIVVFRTDWSKRFGQPDYLEHPFLDAAIAERLLAVGVTVVGVDTLSPDRTDATAASADLPFHEVFLGAGGVIIENLTNLSAIDTARDPWISALPLPFTGLDGSPVRAVAMHRA